MRPSTIASIFLAIIAVTVMGLPVRGQSVQRPRGFIRSADPIPNSYIVVFADEVMQRARTRETVTRVADAHAVVPSYVYTDALRGFAFKGTEQVAQLIAADPEVAYVTEDGIVRESSVQHGPRCDDADFAQCLDWGLDRIDQPDLPGDSVYRYSGNFKTVAVYILDSGINPNHTDFLTDGVSRITIGGDFTGGNGVDCDGHGTHVAGTVGGTYAGVVKYMYIQSLKVFPCSPEEVGGYPPVIAAVDFVVQHGARPAVMNLSLGGPPSVAMDDAIRYAINNGVVAVIAAGNDGVDASTVSPARVDEAITVGASNWNDSRWSFSNVGAVVDIFAPGSHIHSTAWYDNTSFRYASGTSQAAPHVTGAAALYLSGHRTATPAEVRNWLVAHALTGQLTDIPAGTPNRLLQIQDINDASAGTVSVPARMHPGRQYLATVSFPNTGPAQWSAFGPRPYFIGSRNPTDNFTWGINRVPVPSSAECCFPGFPDFFNIPTSRDMVVNFPITAPSTPGSYNFAWQMIQETGEWFGGLATLFGTVQVVALTDDASFYTQSVPPKMNQGNQYRVSVTFTNTGSETWGFLDTHLQPVFDDWPCTVCPLVPQMTPSQVGPGEHAVFNFVVSALNTPQVQRFQWRLLRGSNTIIGDPSPRKDIQVGYWGDDAELVSARVPKRMRPGQTYEISVTYRNRGIYTWNDVEPYWLGIRQSDRFVTSNHPLSLPNVQPGELVTFSFAVTAPATPGIDHLQWQMLNAGNAGYGYSEWFGDVTLDIAVTVANWTDDAAFESVQLPGVMTPGASYQALVTFRNTGTTTWTDDWPYWLSTADGNVDFWSFNTVLPVHTVGPNQTVTVPVPLTAPTTPGDYLLSWQMVDASENASTEPTPYFGEFSPPFQIIVSTDGIFADGVESANFSAWSTASTGGGDLSVVTGAAMEGRHAIRAVVNDRTPLYVQDNTPSNEGQYRGRFLINPATFNPGESSGHRRVRLFLGFDSVPTTQRAFTIVQRRVNGVHSIKARALTDDGTRVETDFFDISANTTHSIYFEWERSSAPGANNGFLALWIDEGLVSLLSDIDNDTLGIDAARLGILNIKEGASGTEYLDHFASRRAGFIFP